MILQDRDVGQRHTTGHSPQTWPMTDLVSGGVPTPQAAGLGVLDGGVASSTA